MTTPNRLCLRQTPAAMVQQAREAAGPLCRSVAGQIEYCATLGRVVEHTGLTVQEAQTAIEGCEAAARQTRAKAQATKPGDGPNSLEAQKRGVLAVSTDGTLQAQIKQSVEDNRQQANQQAAA